MSAASSQKRTEHVVNAINLIGGLFSIASGVTAVHRWLQGDRGIVTIILLILGLVILLLVCIYIRRRKTIIGQTLDPKGVERHCTRQNKISH
jgi:hypothetical protein